jgi:hypothetical protein
MSVPWQSCIFHSGQLKLWAPVVSRMQAGRIIYIRKHMYTVWFEDGNDEWVKTWPLVIWYSLLLSPVTDAELHAQHKRMQFVWLSASTQNSKCERGIVNHYLNLAISLRGPPMPHPTSNTCQRRSQDVRSAPFGIAKDSAEPVYPTIIPSVRPRFKAMKCSYRLMLSRRVSPCHLIKQIYTQIKTRLRYYCIGAWLTNFD